MATTTKVGTRMSGKYLGSDGLIHHVSSMGNGEFKVCCTDEGLTMGILCYYLTLATLSRRVSQGKLTRRE